MKKFLVFTVILIMAFSLFSGTVMAYGNDDCDYYDGEYYYNDYEYEDETADEWTPFTYILPALITGFIIALIVVLVMKGGMTSVYSKHSASDYVVNGSLNLTVKRDNYLYTNVTRTPRPKNNQR